MSTPLTPNPFPWLRYAEDAATALFETGGNIALAFIRRLAPFAVPLAPAAFFGHAVYEAVIHMTANIVAALAVGGAAAIGLESAGIIAAHYAVRFYASGQNSRGHAATLSAIIYLVIGVSVIWLLESTTTDAKLVGSAMFAIAGLVYLVIGLADMDRADQEAQAAARAAALAEQQQREADQRQAEKARQQREDDQRAAQLAAERERHAWEREQETARLQLQHEARLREMELAARVKVEQSRAKAASASERSDRSDNGHNAPTNPADWRLLSDADKIRMLDLTTSEIEQKYHVSASTARRWLRTAREMTDQVPAHLNGHH